MIQFIKNAFRKIRYGDPVYVVSGLPRSGTSMLMNMLAAGGLSVVSDAQREADDDNPLGYFEHERIKDLENESPAKYDAGLEFLEVPPWLRDHLEKIVDLDA